MTLRILILLAVLLPANCCPWGACYVRKTPARTSCFMADDINVCNAADGDFHPFEWCKR